MLAATELWSAKWHASQVLTKQRDSSLRARFRLSSTIEIKSWILSFGANASVIEPESLCAEIAAEIEQMLKVYQGQAVKNLLLHRGQPRALRHPCN